MSERDIRVYIDDILDSIAKIAQYTKTITEEDFLADTQIQDAVLRRLEIMGEAVKNIPDDIRKKSPQVPWKKIAGLRDIPDSRVFWGQFASSLENCQRRPCRFEREDIGS